MHAWLAARLGRPVATLATAAWYVFLVVAITYFALLDQAPFRYGQL